MLHNDQREIAPEFQQEGQDEDLAVKIERGRIYKEMMDSEGWKDFRTVLENKILASDRKRDQMSDAQFQEWRAATHEINIIRNLLSYVRTTVDQGQYAIKTLASNMSAVRAGKER